MEMNSSPKLINGDNPEMFGQGIKISEEETLRSTISMNHNKRWGAFIAIKSNCVYKPGLIACRSKPPDFGTRRPSAYVNLFLNIRSSEIQAIRQTQLNMKELIKLMNLMVRLSKPQYHQKSFTRKLQSPPKQKLKPFISFFFFLFSFLFCFK